MLTKTPVALLCDGKLVGTHSLVHVPAIGDDVLLASEVVTKWRVIHRVWNPRNHR